MNEKRFATILRAALAAVNVDPKGSKRDLSFEELRLG
jgi:hypothetical protein